MPGISDMATAALSARQWGGWVKPTTALSPLGTQEQPSFPHWLSNNPLPQGRPWGGCDAWNTNYYETTPNTGVTRYYDWTVEKQSCAPDGVNITCLLANGQYPGPTIEANWGDWIEVKVTNNVEDEGTAIHWHGLLQKGTQYMDGVPGFSQCPIAPYSSFTYRFQADLYGTSHVFLGDPHEHTAN
ncbi:hypothetical protein LTS14_006690 [Recurvomyces mirabilis]|nr:hypothetical protein LTS14_006690 [Recurvomyces mirabilis]